MPYETVLDEIKFKVRIPRRVIANLQDDAEADVEFHLQQFGCFVGFIPREGAIEGSVSLMLLTQVEHPKSWLTDKAVSQQTAPTWK